VPPHARAGAVARGHRFAADPRCSADQSWRMEVTKRLALLLVAAGLSGAEAGEPLVQVSLAESRLCLPRNSVAFFMRNLSSRTVDVACSIERQSGAGEWTYYQESIGSTWASKTARVWRLTPGHEERAIWPANHAQHGRFASGRYRVIVSVHIVAKDGEPASELQRTIGPEFALEPCKQ
jgi:hypothetical protein